MTIEDLYQERCRTRHNIDEHLPTLRHYAERCEHVTEFGRDIGFSTTAFLAAQPRELHCYDINRRLVVGILESLAGETRFVFHVADTLEAEIDETDLLFVDTVHTYAQVQGELARHGNKARRFLILHDIVAFPEIVPAILEFVEANPHWQLREWLTNQSGLAVYERV